MEDYNIETFYNDDKNEVEIRFTSKTDGHAKANFIYYGDTDEFEDIGFIDKIHFLTDSKEDKEKYRKILETYKIMCQQVVKYNKIV